MSTVVAFPSIDDEPEWIVDAREAPNGYSVSFARRGAFVCSEFFGTYAEVTAAARILRLTHDADVQVLLTPEGVSA